MNIHRISLKRLKLPLSQPYRLSYRTFHEFEPFLIEVVDDEGRIAFGDAHVSPGSSAETRDGAWSHLGARLPKLIGLAVADAKEFMLRDFSDSKVATTAVVTALEALEKHPVLDLPEPGELPLLVPVGAMDRAGIEREVEAAVEAGFDTLKVKVGKDVDADVVRLRWIQKAAAGRAVLRVDANRAYSREDAIRFVRGIDPEGIALFEQPCEADEWEDNAAVAAASGVPVMLDEPICTLQDIERAAGIPGVGFCKVKLKRFGGVERLEEGIRHIQAHDMGAVLGDGLGSDLHAWLEACVAARTIRNAGEFNGFLKMTGRLFRSPLPCHSGRIHIPAHYRPELDQERVDAATTQAVVFN